MSKAFMTFMTKEDLVSRYALLHDRKIFSKSWSKQKIAYAIGDYLERLGFKPFRCYCGTTLKEHECYDHFIACTAFKEHGDYLQKHWESDLFGCILEYSSLGRYFQSPYAWELSNLEESIAKQRIEEGLPACNTCGMKIKVLQRFVEREMVLVKCQQCNAIAIMDVNHGE